MIVEARDLRFRYGAATALDGLSFTAGRGELYGILGPNGSGKSTLFRLLATLLRPDSGTLLIDGLDVSTQARDVRRRLGIVFQSCTLDARLTVEENLRLSGALSGLNRAEAARRTDRALAGHNLTDRRRELAGTLSGGWQKRLEIARALLAEPRVLLLDEATAGLDPRARQEFWETIGSARASGVTVIFTTHLLDEAARAERLLLMHRGVAVAEDTPAGWLRRFPGEVLEMETDAAAALDEWMRQRGARRIGGSSAIVRYAAPHAARALAEASEAAPELIRSARVRAANLEDAFLDATGKTLDD